jgi:Lar family restriction alleviation protein
MTDLSEQLEACPFCGGVADVTKNHRTEHYISCAKCSADGPFEAERAEAIAAWNRRAPAAAPAPVAASDDVITAYQPGTWFDARTIDEMQAFYMSRLPAIREAAKEHGYAIGLHGSARRDFDLLAVPWCEGAADRDTLARAIADAACGIRREGAYDWETKPAGRIATSIPVCWTAHDNPDFDNMISAGHIDLSVIAAAPPAPAAAPIVQPVADELRELAELLPSLRPNYGDVGSRDVDVAARRATVDRIAASLAALAAAALTTSTADAERIIDVILHLIHGKIVLNYFDSEEEGFFSDEHERDYLLQEVTAAMAALGMTSTADAKDADSVTIPMALAQDIHGALHWRDAYDPEAYQRVKTQVASIVQGAAITSSAGEVKHG